MTMHDEQDVAEDAIVKYHFEPKSFALQFSMDRFSCTIVMIFLFFYQIV